MEILEHEQKPVTIADLIDIPVFMKSKTTEITNKQSHNDIRKGQCNFLGNK